MITKEELKQIEDYLSNRPEYCKACKERMQRERQYDEEYNNILRNVTTTEFGLFLDFVKVVQTPEAFFYWLLGFTNRSVLTQHDAIIIQQCAESLNKFLKGEQK